MKCQDLLNLFGKGFRIQCYAHSLLLVIEIFFFFLQFRIFQILLNGIISRSVALLKLRVGPGLVLAASQRVPVAEGGKIILSKLAKQI